MGAVKLLSRWDGWCDPCGIERPLLLTAKGEFGPRAWLSGVGMEDRTLVLTCAVCGEWQLCPWDEEFPKESVARVEAGPLSAQSTEAEVVTKRGIFARSRPAPVAELPVIAEATIVELPPVFQAPAVEAPAVEVPASEAVAVDKAPVPSRVRAEAEVAEVRDAELLRSIARAEARALQVAAAFAAADLAAAEPEAAKPQPAAEPEVAIKAESDEQPVAAKRRGFGRKRRDIAETVEVAETTEPAPAAKVPPTAPARAKRRTAPVQHIVLQTAYGPARPTAVPSLPAPRRVTPNEQDEALHLLAEGLDLITSAGR